MHKAGLKKKKIHLIGIGGSGMSGIGSLLIELGSKVSGSDLKSSSTVERLRSEGAEVYLTHDKKNINSRDLVVVSSAILKENSELQEAKKNKIKIMKRAEMLAVLMEDKKKIVVGGTHGKTTTASLIVSILEKGGKNPSFVFGGELQGTGINSKWGEGEYFVIEADESDGSIICFRADIGVITNIEEDHMDYYRDINHLKEIFARFIDKTSPGGKCYCYFDDEHIKNVIGKKQREIISYGFSRKADIQAAKVVIAENKVNYDFIYFGKNIGKLELNVMGRHNVLNSLPAVSIALEAGMPFDLIKEVSRDCYKVKRRMEIKFKSDKLIVVDDYAHHPTEIKATLNSLKSFNYQKIIAVFQPHRYSRLKFLEEDFINSFKEADSLILTDVYGAGEKEINGINSRNLFEKLKDKHRDKEVTYIAKLDDIKSYLEEKIEEQTVIAVLGAGDISSIVDDVVGYALEKF